MTISADFKDRAFKGFKDSPHIVAIFEIIADPMQDLSDVADYILAHLSIDDSEGLALDMLGELIGVTRPPMQEPNIFTLRRPGDVTDPDNDTGFGNDDDPVSTGGYLGTCAGLALVSDPDAEMADEDFRFLLRQKAASFRSKFTRENIYLYLIAFGSRCVIDDDTVLDVEYDPVTYYDLGAWEKFYVLSRGFKPGGVATDFRDMMRHGDSI